MTPKDQALLSIGLLAFGALIGSFIGYDKGYDKGYSAGHGDAQAVFVTGYLGHPTLPILKPKGSGSFTRNLHLYLPAISEQNWGDAINQDLQILDEACTQKGVPK